MLEHGAAGMRSIVRTAALVDAWFDTLTPEQQATAHALRRAVLATEPSLAQALKWGNLVFVHDGTHALAIVCHRDHANLQVFDGAAIARTFPMLDGVGKAMRHLRCRYGAAVDEALVAQITRACIAALPARGARPSAGSGP